MGAQPMLRTFLFVSLFSLACSVEALARCDGVKRPEPGNRSPKRMAERRKQFVEMASPIEDAAIAAVMPKGRNFH